MIDEPELTLADLQRVYDKTLKEWQYHLDKADFLKRILQQLRKEIADHERRLNT